MLEHEQLSIVANYRPKRKHSLGNNSYDNYVSQNNISNITLQNLNDVNGNNNGHSDGIKDNTQESNNSSEDNHAGNDNNDGNHNLEPAKLRRHSFMPQPSVKIRASDWKRRSVDIVSITGSGTPSIAT